MNRRVFIQTSSAVAVLSLTPFEIGCNTGTWIAEFDKYLATLTPAIINIIEIIAIAQGAAPNAGLIAKIEADAAALKQIAQDYASASTSDQPGILPKLNTVFNVFQADAQLVFQLLPTNIPPVEQATILGLISLVQVTINLISMLIPMTSALREDVMRKVSTGNFVIQGQQVPSSNSDFMAKYNAKLNAGTNGQFKQFDTELRKKHLHYHNWFLRAITAGVAK